LGAHHERNSASAGAACQPDDKPRRIFITPLLALVLGLLLNGGYTRIGKNALCAVIAGVGK
jgi:hypothetical protein